MSVELQESLKIINTILQSDKEIEYSGGDVSKVCKAYSEKYGVLLKSETRINKTYLVPVQMVVHCRKSHYDVYIGRGKGIWGNPFHEDQFVGETNPRQACIAAYKEWILTEPEMLARLPELKGKILGCWCYPKPCHGDVLLELVQRFVINRETLPYDPIRYAASLKRFNEACDADLNRIKKGAISNEKFGGAVKEFEKTAEYVESEGKKKQHFRLDTGEIWV